MCVCVCVRVRKCLHVCFGGLQSVFCTVWVSCVGAVWYRAVGAAVLCVCAGRWYSGSIVELLSRLLSQRIQRNRLTKLLHFVLDTFCNQRRVLFIKQVHQPGRVVQGWNHGSLKTHVNISVKAHRQGWHRGKVPAQTLLQISITSRVDSSVMPADRNGRNDKCYTQHEYKCIRNIFTWKVCTFACRLEAYLLPLEHSCILLVFLFFVYRKGTRNNVNVPLFISLYRRVYCEGGCTQFAVQFVTFA